jgi:hypothetical protein
MATLCAPPARRRASVRCTVMASPVVSSLATSSFGRPVPIVPM